MTAFGSVWSTTDWFENDLMAPIFVTTFILCTKWYLAPPLSKFAGKNWHILVLDTPDQTRYSHGWLENVTYALQPFPILSNPIMGLNGRHDSVWHETLVRYFKLLVELVESRILEALPDQLANFFDGWTVISTEYTVVFAVFTFIVRLNKNKNFCDSPLLRTRETQNATEHFLM